MKIDFHNSSEKRYWNLRFIQNEGLWIALELYILCVMVRGKLNRILFLKFSDRLQFFSKICNHWNVWCLTCLWYCSNYGHWHWIILLQVYCLSILIFSARFAMIFLFFFYLEIFSKIMPMWQMLHFFFGMIESKIMTSNHLAINR